MPYQHCILTLLVSAPDLARILFMAGIKLSLSLFSPFGLRNSTVGRSPLKQGLIVCRRPLRGWGVPNWLSAQPGRAGSLPNVPSRNPCLPETRAQKLGEVGEIG